MPAVNSEAMGEHLAEISTQVAPGSHAVAVCDGAGWHQPATRLAVPESVSLLRLPSYAPELNPIENVREYLRGNKLSRRVWDGYNAILAACKGASKFFITDANRIGSITHLSWETVRI